ncbi:type II secretion system protein GspL [Herbaspirillum sp. SJZ107]|uniref:type II secretion system protein GspL n=1 Tax=Herbaspirillum sp. SJZ107 TaxID=2572881 RepID=UPI001174DA1D|nr:type II secretion system protein GspL [Herbaspirillum sp. SJZ107]TQK05165.1 type II secretion system protein L (GspL) [Herbaspirillum sp. SJZ107]
MTTLYIRHPARAEGEHALSRFALVNDGGVIEQQGEGPLRNLGDLVGTARRVVLLLAGADVSLLSVQAPPLTGARLKAALPALVEEHILGDPEDSVLVAAPEQPDGTRPIAVADRDWLEAIVRALLAQGARSVAAIPAQLCLPLQPGSVSAAVDGAELTLRQGLFQGFGLALEAVPAVVLQTARAFSGDAPLVLYVPRALLGEYQVLAQEAGPGITLETDDWAHWIAASRSTALDLVSGLGAAGTPVRDWRRWRWPLRLILLALAVNLAGLNLDWLRLKREAATVQQSMTQTFRQVYPRDPVVDPVVQMRQNMARARAGTGELSPDEFTYLAAAFGEAARATGREPGIASIEYRERALSVKVKPGTADPGLTGQLRTALAARALTLDDTTPGTWVIRSGARGTGTGNTAGSTGATQ